MTLFINGKEQKIAQDPLNITEILTLNAVDIPEMVSVQLNGEFIDKSEFISKNVEENDQVDFLYFMGGGE